MKTHAQIISKAVQFVFQSRDFHAVLIEGPAGWGKSTAVGNALAALKIEPRPLASYSTPLNFFNFLEKNKTECVLVDDSAGLFASELSMSILKSATWPQRSGKRCVAWGSTTSKVTTQDFEFKGKIIIVCNGFPKDSDAHAVRSRSVCHKIEVNLEEARSMLKVVARNRERFPNAEISRLAVNYILAGLSKETLDQISLRTLEMVYDFIEHSPTDWEPFLEKVLRFRSAQRSPEEVMKSIAVQKIPVHRQELLFQQETGLRRRSFYMYKRKLESL
jgi:hypothetical protein